jgi:Na+(H+)/acetate symporter ActP
MLTWVVLGGLTVGGAAAALGALRGLSHGPTEAAGPRHLGLGLVAGAALLTALLPLDPWTLLAGALALGASALAPAAVLACWSERATPQGVAGGAVAGLAAFLLLLVVGAGIQGALSDGWGSLAVVGPAAVAVPVHGAVGWFLRSRSARPLPSGLDGLSAPVPARPRPG